MLTKLTMSTNFWRKILKCVEKNAVTGVRLSMTGSSGRETVTYEKTPATPLFSLEATTIEKIQVGDIYGNAVVCKITNLAEISDKDLADKIAELVDLADSNDTNPTENVQTNSEAI